MTIYLAPFLWATGIFLTLAACQPAGEDRQNGEGLNLSRAMSTQADADFVRAETVRRFEFPRDHGPHPDYATEWWYFSGNLADAGGRRFGYQLTLFRIGLKPPHESVDSTWRGHELYMGHLAISDIRQRQHFSEERFSRAAAGLAGAEAVPLKVWLGPWTVRGAEHGLYPLRLAAEGEQLAIDLNLSSGSKPMVLQGERGLSRKGEDPGNASYYYSYTRLPTRGEIQIGERQFEVSGNSWFDREWSSSALDVTQQGWDWFSLHLGDGREVMFYRMRGIDGKAQRFSSGILVDAYGQVEKLGLDKVQLQVLSEWTSPTGAEYPLEWSFAIPHRQIELRITAAFEDQEMRQSVHYWEGAVVVSGSHDGNGYLELSGYAPEKEDP